MVLNTQVLSHIGCPTLPETGRMLLHIRYYRNAPYLPRRNHNRKTDYYSDSIHN